MIEATEMNVPRMEESRPLTRLWQRRDVWQIALLFIIFYLVGSVAAALLAGDSSLLLTVNVLVASALAGGGSILLVNARRQRHSLRRLGFVPFSRRWLLVGSVLIATFAVGRVLLLDWLATTFPALTLGMDFLAESLLFDGAAAIIISSIGVVVLVPIWEEFFFRGYVHNALRNRLGFWSAIVVSSLLFGAFHLIPLQALGAFLLALPLAWAYERSGSLWLVITMHALNNLIALGLGYLVG